MHANMLSANIPAYRKIRSVRCIWLPLKCSSRIFILEIWKFLIRREEEQGGGRLRFQSSPEGQVRILVWNIPPLYFASIKDVLIITPISSLPLSSPLPSASIFFILSINPPSILSSLLPNVLLSGLRWNRKCWFNNSRSEFWAVCCYSLLQVYSRGVTCSLPSSLCDTEWNHASLCDAWMNSNDSCTVCSGITQRLRWL